MEQERDPRSVLLCGLACLLSSAVAAAATAASGARGLDVGLWAVLAPLVTGGLLALVVPVRSRAHAVRDGRAVVVLPDPVSAPRPLPDPAVQAREAVVEQLREAVLAARRAGAPVEQLLVLTRDLHEAELDRARAVLSAGGWVPQEVRDELALRDRPAPARGLEARGL